MKRYKPIPFNDVYNPHDLFELASVRAAEFPDGTAFISKSGTVTYSRFLSDFSKFGAYLRSRGFENSHIALLGENSYDWITAYFGAVCSGNVIVPLDRELSAEDKLALIKKSDAAAVICSDSYRDDVSLCDAEIIPMGEVLSCEADETLISSLPQDIEKTCAMVFTSGTTGEPKGVMLSQKNLLSDIYACARAIHVSGATMITLPMNHTFGFTTGALGMFFYHTPIAISASLHRFRQDIVRFAPQNMFVVPQYLEMLHKEIMKTARAQKREKSLLRALRLSRFIKSRKLRRKMFSSVLSSLGGNLDTLVVGGAPCDKKYVEFFESIGIAVLIGYGITECSPVVSVYRNEYSRPEGVGQALPCCEVKCDEGELLVRGSNVFSGYYKNEAATAEAFSGEWYRTGDLGYIDGDGFIYITGRKKNLIILANGKNIAPEELEAKISDISGVGEVLVYGDGGRITAEIFADPDSGIGEDAIREGISALNSSLPSFKQIAAVKFRDTEFPKTTTRKIKRNYAEV